MRHAITRTGLRAFLVSLLLIGGFALEPAISRELSMKPGNSSGSVKVNGKRRTFRLHIPKSATPGEKLPVVIVLHGAVGCGWSGAWDSRMSDQAEKRKFIAVYPNGFARTWNAGDCCGPARKLKVDDVAFMRVMIEHLKQELPVDPNQVFVTGISNGGMLAFKLGRELSDQIAAIAPIQGCMYESTALSDQPISVIIVHGTADSIIRYDGGIGSKFGYKVNAKSVADTVKFWVKHNNCSDDPSRNEKGNVVTDLYSGGKNGTEVCLYTLKGGGHAWPGGRRCVFAGDRPSKELSATEVICDFFLSHPKRASTGIAQSATDVQ